MPDYKIDWKKPQPPSRHLARLLHANFSQITAFGISNNRNVAGTNKSSHAEGRALDIHLNANVPDELSLGDGIFEALIRRAAQIGVENVIWNREIWSVARRGPREYKGENPHTTRTPPERSGQPAIDNLANALVVARIAAHE